MLSANKEQRLFSRIQINATVILATTSERVQGTCLNLSPEGMLMEVECGRCQPGQQWQLVLPSAGERVPPLKAMAQVLRVEEGVTSDLVAVFLEEVH
ncbi:PilZ domain-containing protein [Oceanimonas sp. CHS3-5]|uniref:PilZ domain-containing protein n=1 Tax=Oceanimonas sp. CHS3-5 TaxID=3068186 RepID=UPI00273ED003|nr:PilZ domain-containing protein [Oceanimonas sp. CHS3-5]MDP5292011.1 PilZ domain-containing protein [Oceanimonas sp. CHS3-5]